MNRRNFLRAGAASAVVAAPGFTAAAPRRRPNLLYVFDDQHRACSMPGEPYSQVVAPTLAAFRQANFSMDTCVSNYPLCCPYRGILMTGRWPFQTGLWNNSATIRSDELSLGRLFKGQGYHTSYVGKWHLGHQANFIPAGPDRIGFDDWHVWERTNNHYTSWTFDPNTGQRIQPKGWTPVLMTDQAIDILKQRQQAASEPWMMMVSYNPPHPPFNPPDEDQEPYPLPSLKSRPNVEYPLKGQDAPGRGNALASEEDHYKAMRGYYGGITGVDKEFARLLKALDDSGQANDTIVIFTSDHGEMMGSQGRMAKSVPFEESCRVPFVVRYPGVTKAGGKSDMLFAAVDIYPTICGLAGIPVPKHCVGRDLSAAMRGETVANPPKAVFLLSQHDASSDDEGGDGGRGGGRGKRAGKGGKGARELRAGENAPGTGQVAPDALDNATYTTLPTYRGIRTDTHTYAVADSGRWLLFDNVADPFQMKNLIKDPAQAGLIKQFDAQIMAWLKAAQDPFPYAQAITKVSSFPS